VLGATQPHPPNLVHAVTRAVGPFLTHFWWLVLIVGALLLARGIQWLITERRLARSGIGEIDQMDGITFERRLVHLFNALGYNVEQTRARGDYGADLVLERDSVRIVVQAKRWTKNVGVKAIQEAVAAKPMYRCERAMVVTHRYFTDQAKRLARANDVRLWDRDELVSALLRGAEQQIGHAVGSGAIDQSATQF
jgi:restriction system protein